MYKKSFFLFVGIILILPFVLSKPTSAKESFQLIAHQQTVGKGGEIHYSILYDVPATELSSNGVIKVKIPDHTSIENRGKAEWDESTNTLIWGMDKPANVFHFSLKPNEKIEDDKIELKAQAEISSGNVTTPIVTVQIQKAEHQPFFQGFPDGNFRPQAHLTRAETAAIVSRIKDLKDDSKLEDPYTDVSPQHWAHDYIKEVTNAGYMKGYRHKFRPDKPISRAELITLLLRLRGISSIPLTNIAEVSKHWAENNMNTAKALGFLDSKHQTLHPDVYVTRAESAKLLTLSFYRGELKEGKREVIQHFPDVNESHWAYAWIEEASEVAHKSVRDGKDEHLIEYLPNQTEPF